MKQITEQTSQGILLGSSPVRRGELIERLGLTGLLIEILEMQDGRTNLRLHAKELQNIAPGWDTLQLHKLAELDSASNPAHLEREIWLAMLASPMAFEFPSLDELDSAIRMRCNIVAAARDTALAFHTSKIERPEDSWAYSEERGFTVKPGVPLIDALKKAIHPEPDGRRYAFSCYRASEYVILLGIAQELAATNPAQLQRLQALWETRAIMSREFHEVFLHEYGAMENPLPPKFFVPGDRLWFRNPDERSSDVPGFEGSWVFYLGGGLFSNFWAPERPYTLTDKCVEIYHWRNGVYLDEAGEPRMDESAVEQHVQNTLRDSAETQRILELMMRLRPPRGEYGTGGCLDASREMPRHLCTESGLPLPCA